jgi:hypothetical protein
MTNTLKAVRTELGRQLGLTGATVYQFIPERPQPPCVIIESGTPYLSPGTSFCEFQISFNVLLLVSTAANEIQTEQLDQLICDSLNVLDFELLTVDQPGQFSVNNAEYFGTRISINTFHDLDT